MPGINLNRVLLDSEEEKDREPLTDFSTSAQKFDSVECHFKNLESKLIKLIKQYENGLIFGCVAWLTSVPILEALAKCKNVQIVIQKEDFLRPDLSSRKDWTKKLRTLYANLVFNIQRYHLRKPLHYMSVCGDPGFDAVRCVGEHNSAKKPSNPKSHHKFIVFCGPPVPFNTNTLSKTEYDHMLEKEVDVVRSKEELASWAKYACESYAPEVVWTGSFNFSKNATYSFENAIVMKDKSGINPILNAYLHEHHQILALSESLDWECPWMAPDYRIGT